MIRKLLWILCCLLAVIIGCYPVLYFTTRHFQLLSLKETVITSRLLWRVMFYSHIVTAGMALLTGWPQFIGLLRRKWPLVHRRIGKCYIIMALAAAMSGIYLAFYASGGMLSAMGFFWLGMVWFGVTLKAYQVIRQGKIRQHEQWMTCSFACCFAAVTLRLWLVLLLKFLDFKTAYNLVAWLCWLPNMAVAGFLIRQKQRMQAAG